MILRKNPYQNASVFPLFSRQTSVNTGFWKKKWGFVFPLFSQNGDKNEVETSRLLVSYGKEIRLHLQKCKVR